MLNPGVYPAAVTPMTPDGAVDLPAVARLLAWFEASGCAGAVVAGTNGEGPSLSTYEKRDLIRAAVASAGKLSILLGVATSSLEEAVWLCEQARKAGAAAALVMPPGYFREATEEGIGQWFSALIERTALPIVVYNFPQRTGIELSAALLGRLAKHERMAGVKDSSGKAENLAAYRAALADGKCLFVGNETLLWDALEAGWSGTISGVANVVPRWMSQIVAEFMGGARSVVPARESAQTKFALALPVVKALRAEPQPATNKALLESLGLLPCGAVRLPLLSADPSRIKGLRSQIEERVGVPTP
ncbi:MAG: dihydrodipicolinate synthase family protein [Fimbriimonas ginsengisoli]|uniref:Dihydrodipicolinate synthase family protein n=1 Tax=Fimbriimonas ginsengisoli TaxID=1005039 RepID=A0A931LV13_FIMGI|nr:dihydrodipicolinate synthase family protein [Fimbriimonas ginsengisoli]MBI3721675.1 dihydrodipicolinate synthase family protein [Fimbriimonas ginsengisoli]